MSKLLEAWLDEERTKALREVAVAVDIDEIPRARILVGGLRVVETLLSVIRAPERAAPEPEEPFVDPAQIKRKVIP